MVKTHVEPLHFPSLSVVGNSLALHVILCLPPPHMSELFDGSGQGREALGSVGDHDVLTKVKSGSSSRAVSPHQPTLATACSTSTTLEHSTDDVQGESGSDATSHSVTGGDIIQSTSS